MNSETLSKRIGIAVISWTVIALVLLSGWGWDKLGPPVVAPGLLLPLAGAIHLWCLV